MCIREVKRDVKKHLCTIFFFNLLPAILIWYWTYGGAQVHEYRTDTTSPTSLLWVSTIFFYSLWIPDLTFQIKITLSVRNLSGTNMYICMWSFFARYSSFYIIHCVHDKMNNYFIFFLANIEIWPNKITAQIILNQDESGNPVWRYDTDHILDLFDFTNNLCS